MEVFFFRVIIFAWQIYKTGWEDALIKSMIRETKVKI